LKKPTKALVLQGLFRV